MEALSELRQTVQHEEKRDLIKIKTAKKTSINIVQKKRKHNEENSINTTVNKKLKKCNISNKKI